MDSAPVYFKDRKVGLVIFGVMTVIAGCGLALLVPLMIVGTQMAAKSPNPPPTAPNLLPVAAIYGVLAIVLIWLGIGSIKARRWARALLAIWSWSWLVIGVVALFGMAWLFPTIQISMQAAQPAGQPPLPPGVQSAILAVTLAMIAVLFVILPLIWALFYSSKNARATCEFRDPITRWTDRCPLPVLAISLWAAFSALSMCIMPAMHSVAPFFGLLLSGVAGAVFYLCLAAIWAYAGWRLYHLDLRGWWIVVVALVLFAISSAITYSRHDLGEVYARMGYGVQETAQIQGLIGSHFPVWSSLIFVVPLLGYFFYIRRFFIRATG